MAPKKRPKKGELKLVAILNRVEVYTSKDRWVLMADKRDVVIEKEK